MNHHGVNIRTSSVIRSFLSLAAFCRFLWIGVMDPYSVETACKLAFWIGLTLYLDPSDSIILQTIHAFKKER